MGILSYGYKAIKNVKPKAISDATKRFKAKVSGIKAGVKKGTDEFQKANPKSLVTDKDIKKIQKETSEKHTKRVRKEYLREPKKTGGRIGYKGGKLVGGQKKIDVAAPFGKITGEDFKKLRNKKKVI